MLLVLPLHI